MTASTSHTDDDRARQRSIAFLNWAHALDHFVLLIYPTVVISLQVVYGRSYSELIALSSAAFVAFGIFSLPAGWLADHWSRRNMMAAFYIGCGLSLAGAGFAPNLTALAVAMFALGMFASIYHPVGMAMLIEASNARGRTLAFNGVCGNLGVSLAAGISAALATWFSWRAAFFAPAAILVATGIFYLWVTPDDRHHVNKRQSKPAVPLGGKYRLIDIPISNCINSNITQIFVLTQFQSASLNRHISRTYRFSSFSTGFVEVLAAEQTKENPDWFQGTADAVRQATRHFRDTDAEYFLILAGDHIYRMDFAELIEAHIERNADLASQIQKIFLFKLSSPDSAWTVDLKKGEVNAGESVPGECTLELVKLGSMPLGKGCTGDPARDAANAACLTAAEQQKLADWIAGGLREK